MAALLRRSWQSAVLSSLLAGVLTGCSDKAVGPVVDDPNAPAEFIAVRRAWAPGERAANIAAAQTDGRFGPFSSLAASIYADPDSYAVIVRNPAFQGRVGAAPGPGPAFAVQSPRFDAAWHITGLDIRTIDDTQSPPDTVDWLGIFWSNPAEWTWSGFIFAYSPDSVVSGTVVNTAVFDAAKGKSGAGAGEVRQSTQTFWSADGSGSGSNNQINVFNASYGTASVVASGPFAGGATRSGTIAGRAKRVSMVRDSGATAPTSFLVDLTFGGGISSVQLFCRFTFPANACQSTALYALHRAASEGTLGSVLVPVMAGQPVQTREGVAGNRPPLPLAVSTSRSNR